MAEENNATVQACLEVKMMDTCLGKLLRIFLVLWLTSSWFYKERATHKNAQSEHTYLLYFNGRLKQIEENLRVET